MSRRMTYVYRTGKAEPAYKTYDCKGNLKLETVAERFVWPFEPFKQPALSMLGGDELDDLKASLTLFGFPVMVDPNVPSTALRLVERAGGIVVKQMEHVINAHDKQAGNSKSGGS